MKKALLFASILMVLVVFFAACKNNTPPAVTDPSTTNPPEATEPTETTAPVPGTDPAETEPAETEPAETEPSHTHAWSDWVTSLEATCTEKGVSERTCACGEKETQDIDALGHTPGAEATCTTNQTCSVCNVELAAALGHTPGAEATCTDPQNCIVCGDTLAAAKGHAPGADATCTVAQTCKVCDIELTPALGHTEVIDKAVDPTCTETGLTEGKHCSVCSEKLVAQETVDALGHTPGAEATCTDPQNCAICGETLAVANGHTPGAEATCTAAQTCLVCEIELAPALGHTEVTDEAVTPTCTATGLTEGKHCSVCDEIILAQETLDALGHTEVTDAATAPTCTETGLTEGKHCSVCSETLVAQETVDALGHTPGVEATCTTSQTCTVCHAEIVAALGHTEAIDVAVDPTCTETGLTEGKHCSGCSETLVAQETVDALGHTPGVEATCTTNQICTVCEAELVAALGHTEVIDDAVAPTCTETGLTEGKHCSVCDTVLLAQETVAALGHTPGAEATCTTNQICTVCEAELVAALGHTEVIDAAVAPTCTETGLTEGKHCSTCSFVIIVQTNIPKTSHEESQWIVDVEATKETDGVQHIECIGCGVLIRTEILPATGSIGLEYCYVLGKRYVIGVGTCTDSKIVIPEVYNGQPVVGIYDWAFKNCDFLEEIVLPESVTEIHGKAFEGAKNLHTVYYNGSTYTSLFNSGNCFAQIKDVKVVFGGTKIPANILLNCKTVKTVEIRGSVREIGDSAFSGCTNLTSVTISDGVTSIGKQAFYKCSSLVSITLPASVTSIGEEAFYECSSLVSVTLSAGLTSINTRAFCFCRALKTITFRGTAEQWISVSKGTGWNSFVPATLVRCSDGSITIR